MKKQIAFDRQALQNALAQRFTSIESITQFLPMAFWILSLSRTNSFYEIYVVTGLLGIFCWFRDDKGLSHIFNKSQRSELIISCVFSFLILAANYELFLLIANPYAGNNALGLLYAVLHYCIYLPFVFFGGVFAAFYILQFVVYLSLAYPRPGVLSRGIDIRQYRTDRADYIRRLQQSPPDLSYVPHTASFYNRQRPV